MATLSITTTTITTATASMPFITADGTPGDATYVKGDALIYSDDNVLSAFLGDVDITSNQVTYTTGYTDGYTAGFVYTIGSDWTNSASAGSGMYGVCFSGEMVEEVGDAEVVAQEGVSCAGYTFSWDTSSGTVLTLTNTQYYSDAQSDDMTDASWDTLTTGTVDGFKKTWDCEISGAVDQQSVDITDDVTMTCARYMPMESTSASADIRFDGGSALFTGVMRTFDGTDVTDATGTYTFGGAFEAASLAAGVALAALTF